MLRSELYAIPALIGATCVGAADAIGYHGTLAAVFGALVCLTIRLIGVRFDLHAPRVPDGPD